MPSEWPQPLKARGWPKPEWASEYWRTDRRVIFVGTRQIVLADINGDGVEERALNMWRQETWEFGWPMASFGAKCRTSQVYTPSGVVREGHSQAIGLPWLPPTVGIPTQIRPLGFAVNSLLIFIVLGSFVIAIRETSRAARLVLRPAIRA